MAFGGIGRAQAEAQLLVEVESGKVLQADKATVPWYPASVTKLTTLYVTLKAVKAGRITLDTLFTVSPNAVAQQPSKMGFPLVIVRYPMQDDEGHWWRTPLFIGAGRHA